MRTTFHKTLIDRSPGIQNVFRLACDMILADYPTSITVRPLNVPDVAIRGRTLRREKSFIIEVAEHDPAGMFKTLVHELRHIFQILCGQLKRITGGWLWEGRYYPSHTSYWDRPWEIDAHRCAGRMLATFGDFV